MRNDQTNNSALEHFNDSVISYQPLQRRVNQRIGLQMRQLDVRSRAAVNKLNVATSQ